MAVPKKQLVKRLATGCVVLGLATGIGVIAHEGGIGTHDVTVNGAGSTAAANFYYMAASQYGGTHSHVQIGYQAIGSGKGVQALQDGAVAFAATDTPLTPQQIDDLQAKLGKVVQFPMLDGSTNVIYNLPGVHNLTLSPKLLTDIYSGQIKSWNNPAIQALNPNAKLPAVRITTIRRGDASGTSEAFAQYLASNDARAEKLFGVSSTPSFKGVPTDSTQTVTAEVQARIGGIGYVESGYARAGGVPSARLTVGNHNATYIVAPLHQRDPRVGQALTSWLETALSPADQALAAKAGYTPLSSSQAASALASVNPSGAPLSSASIAPGAEPLSQAKVDAFECAVSPFTGAPDAVKAFYSKPAAKGQKSWVVQAAGTDYRACLDGIAPKGPSHDTIVRDAENKLTGELGQLATLLNQRGGTALKHESSAQLRKLSVQAATLAQNAVNRVVAADGPGRVWSEGPGSVSGRAAQYLIDHNLAASPVAAMIATTLVPADAVTAVHDAAASIGVWQ